MKIHRRMTMTSLAVALCAMAGGCSDMGEGNTNEAEAKDADLTLPATDRIPGFGLSEMNARRDDRIALWEAYHREVIVKECMNQEALHYDIEVAFPTEVAVDVASALDLPDPHDSTVDGSEVGSLSGAGKSNFKKARSLTVEQREDYFQRLYGESSADMELVESTGVLPPGRQDFARGGCFGESWAAIPGVYALKRKIASDTALQQNDKMPRQRTSLPDCEGFPGDAASVLGTGEPDLENRGESAGARCISAQRNRARSALEAGIQRSLIGNEEMTRAHLQQYGSASKSIKRDADFLTFLALSTHGLALDAMLNNAIQDDEGE